MFEVSTVKEMLQSLTTVRILLLLTFALDCKNQILVSNCIHQLALRGDLELLANVINGYLEANEFDPDDPFINVLATSLLELKGFSPVLWRLGNLLRESDEPKYTYGTLRELLAEKYLKVRTLAANEHRRKVDLEAFYSDPNLPSDRIMGAESIRSIIGDGLPKFKRVIPSVSTVFGGPLTSEELDEIRKDGLTE